MARSAKDRRTTIEASILHYPLTVKDHAKRQRGGKGIRPVIEAGEGFVNIFSLL